MSWLENLFKSDAERKKEQERMLRQAERTIETNLANTSDRIKLLEKEAHDALEKVRALMKSGQKMLAKHQYQSYQANIYEMNMQENIRRFFRNKLSQLQFVTAQQSMTAAFGKYIKNLNFDLSKFEEMLADITSATDDTEKMEKIFGKIIDKENAKTNDKVADATNMLDFQDDDLWKALENEAAVEVAGGGVADLTNANTDKNQTSVTDINTGKDRLNALLNNDK